MNNRTVSRLPAASEILAPELEGERHEKEVDDHRPGGDPGSAIHAELRTTNDLGFVLGNAAVGDELGAVLSKANAWSEGWAEVVEALL